MKLNKKTLIATLSIITILIVIWCNNNEVKQTTKQEITKIENINLEDLKTYEDVKNAFDQNIDKITKKEKLRNLDMKNTNLDEILKYAKNASGIASTCKSDSDKISTIDKLVMLNDLENNTSKETMDNTLNYIVNEFEKNNLTDLTKILEYQYIVKYLDKRLQNHPNMKDEKDIIFDMYQICKDVIRKDNRSIDENVRQINKKIDILKSYLSYQVELKEK